MNTETRDCPLCLRWDCDCEDILTKEEYDELVEKERNAKTPIPLI